MLTAPHPRSSSSSHRRAVRAARCPASTRRDARDARPAPRARKPRPRPRPDLREVKSWSRQHKVPSSTAPVENPVGRVEHAAKGVHRLLVPLWIDSWPASANTALTCGFTDPPGVERIFFRQAPFTVSSSGTGRSPCRQIAGGFSGLPTGWRSYHTGPRPAPSLPPMPDTRGAGPRDPPAGVPGVLRPGRRAAVPARRLRDRRAPRHRAAGRARHRRRGLVHAGRACASSSPTAPPPRWRGGSGPVTPPAPLAQGIDGVWLAVLIGLGATVLGVPLTPALVGAVPPDPGGGRSGRDLPADRACSARCRCWSCWPPPASCGDCRTPARR